MGKRTAKILILVVFTICLFLALGDIYLPYDPDMEEVKTNLAMLAKSAAEGETKLGAQIENAVGFIQTSDTPESPEPAEEQEPFDPMSLIQSMFYIYQPTEKVELYSEPKDSRIYKHIYSRTRVTYVEDMGNGYRKVLDKTGHVLFIKEEDFKLKMRIASISRFAETEEKNIPWDAESFTVKYDGDRVLRLTNSIYLKDNVAGVVEKGQTVYKLKDYGQLFYVAMEDGRAGYMNSQCLETTEQPEAPYDIVSSDDSTYAYDEMLEDIELLTKRYKDDLKVAEIGKSTLGNAIPVLIMGNEKAEYKVLVQASIHAREYPSTAVLMKQLEVMLYHINEPNSSGKTYREMMDSIAFYIIPMSNPDGVLLSQMGEISVADEKTRQKVMDIRDANVPDTGSNEYRHYFEQWKANINGVDLNRNFDANWDKVVDVLGEPAGDGYKGPWIFSEAESQLIKKYVDMNEVKITISYHTSGNLIFWWYHQQNEFRDVCMSLAKAIGEKSGYELMGTGSARYSHGGVKDYGVMKGKPGITYEIGRYASPIPPVSVAYAVKRVRVLPEIGYWLMHEVAHEAEWLDKNTFPDG